MRAGDKGTRVLSTPFFFESKTALKKSKVNFFQKYLSLGYWNICSLQHGCIFLFKETVNICSRNEPLIL